MQKRNNTNKKYNFRLMFSFILKYKMYFTVMFLLSLFTCGATYIAPLINATIIDQGINDKNGFILACSVSSLFLLYLILEIISLLSFHLRNKTNFVIKKEIENQVLDYCFEKGRLIVSSGEIDTIIKRDVPCYISFICNFFIDIVKNICSVLFVLYMMLSLQWKLALIIIFLQIILTIIRLKQNLTLEQISLSSRNMFIDFMNVINEITTNIKNIIGTGAKKYLKRKYNVSMQTEFEIARKQTMFELKIASAFSLFSSFITCAILMIGGFFVIKEELTIGLLLSFSQYSSVFLNPVIELLNIPTELSSQYSSIKNVSDILEYMNDNGLNKNLTIKNIRKIQLNNISFSYKDKKILNNLSFEFKTGNIYYIIGESGVGKSTLARLISGQLQPLSGQINYNEYSINQMSVEELTNYMAWVSQDTILFHDTILNNIVLDETIDMKRVREVCQACQILEYIDNLPLGFDTMLAEQGNNFSGGQKNRICLARAIYKNKPIIILDEVTSGVDKITEDKIKKGLKGYFANKIVIIITHSRQFILDPNSIYRLINGNLLPES